MRYLFLTLFIALNNSVNRLDLKADLKDDKLIIMREPVGDVMMGKMNFQIFEKYSKLDLNGYVFKSVTVNKHIIKSWTNPNHKLVIYEVITPIHVDTIYHQRESSLDSVTKKYIVKDGEKLHARGDFIFHTYVIREANKERLVYLRAKQHGLCEYWIGKRRFIPPYESIEIGFPNPNLKGILNMLPD
jgi:hypothetical protein